MIHWIKKRIGTCWPRVGKHVFRCLAVAALVVVTLPAMAQSITVSNATSVPGTITFSLLSTPYTLAQRQTVSIPLLSPASLSIWMCITNCEWRTFPVEPGQRYQVVDSGPHWGMALVSLVAFPITITNASVLPPVAVNAAYSLTFHATGGVPPYRWNIISGKLPSGLTLNTNSGVLSGAATVAGSCTFQVGVSGTDSQKGQKSFTLDVMMGAPTREAISVSLRTPVSNCLYTVPVVIVRFLPTSNGVDLDVTKVPDYWSLNPKTIAQVRSEIDVCTERVKFALEQGTRFRAYKDSNAVPSLGYKVVDVLTFSQHTPGGRFYDPYSSTNLVRYLDYGLIMQAINASNYVNNLGVREFWVWHGPFDDSYPSYRANPSLFNVDDIRGLQESNMSSPLTGDVSNSYQSDDLPLYNTTYTVYEYNIRRSHNEAMENHGHQLERLLDYAYWQRDGNADFFWKKFVGQDASGNFITGRCGWTHMPPNTTNNYDWSNPAVVASDIQDWRPDGLGARASFGTSTFRSIRYNWPGGYAPGSTESAPWFLFWWQSMPGFKNGIPEGSSLVPNWWTYTADWDSAIRGRAVAPVIVSSPTNRTAFVGQSTTFSVTASNAWEPARYRWFFNGLSLPGATNSSLTLTNLTPSQQGNYAVEVYNLAGSLTSFNAALTVVAMSINPSRVAGKIVLNWMGSATLQSATNVLGPYTDAAGTSSPYTNNFSAGAQRFYRLRR